jgi:hypothetical protein
VQALHAAFAELFFMTEARVVNEKALDTVGELVDIGIGNLKTAAVSPQFHLEEPWNHDWLVLPFR